MPAHRHVDDGHGGFVSAAVPFGGCPRPTPARRGKHGTIVVFVAAPGGGVLRCLRQRGPRGHPGGVQAGLQRQVVEHLLHLGELHVGRNVAIDGDEPEPRFQDPVLLRGALVDLVNVDVTVGVGCEEAEPDPPLVLRHACRHFVHPLVVAAAGPAGWLHPYPAAALPFQQVLLVEVVQRGRLRDDHRRRRRCCRQVTTATTTTVPSPLMKEGRKMKEGR